MNKSVCGVSRVGIESATCDFGNGVESAREEQLGIPMQKRALLLLRLLPSLQLHHPDPQIATIMFAT